MDCGDELVAGGNWRLSRVRRKEYRCTACHTQKERIRRGSLKLIEMAAKGGVLLDVPTARQMYVLGADYATAEQAEATEKRGFVYVIAHPAWPQYVKIGRAFDPESRLSGYQTGCPFRAYELKYAVYFEDCHAAEKLIHSTLADYRAEGEWFRMLPTVAERVLDEIGGYL